MTINTKFNVGDEVYVMYDNKITKVIIACITMKEYENNINYPIEEHILYGLKNIPLYPIGNRNWEQSKLFSTKEELIKSL